MVLPITIQQDRITVARHGSKSLGIAASPNIHRKAIPTVGSGDDRGSRV